MTQEEAARAIGRTQPTWSRYATGADPVPLSIAPAVAKFLRRSLSAVVNELAKEQPVPDVPPSLDERLTSVERRVAALEDAVTSGEPPVYTAMLAELRQMKEQLQEVAFAELDADAAVEESAPATPVPRSSRP
jgi:hypothetical protein